MHQHGKFDEDVQAAEWLMIESSLHRSKNTVESKKARHDLVCSERTCAIHVHVHVRVRVRVCTHMHMCTYAVLLCTGGPSAYMQVRRTDNSTFVDTAVSFEKTGIDTYCAWTTVLARQSLCSMPGQPCNSEKTSRP